MVLNMTKKQSVNKKEKYITCSNCETNNSHGSDFCKKCGYTLQKMTAEKNAPETKNNKKTSDIQKTIPSF